MTTRDDVIRFIHTTRDKDALREIIQEATEYLAALEQGAGTLLLVCKNDRWFAVFPSKRRALELGPRLSDAAVLRRANQPPPSPAQFEITAAEAKRRRNQNPELVGRWEDNNRNNRYYDQPAYAKARAAYTTWHKLAGDVLATSLNLTLDAVKQIRLLESRGYKIEVVDNGKV